MYECERLFGISRATEIRELIEQATGEPCPCLQLQPCPLARKSA